MGETIILDACCTPNFAAAGRTAEILRHLPYRFVLGPRARGEALWLAVPGSEEREVVDLQPLLDEGLLAEERLEQDPEAALFMAFSARLAAGEAEAAALAVHRGYVLGTDDRKARRIVAERHPATRLSSTLELLQEWQHLAAPSDA